MTMIFITPQNVFSEKTIVRLLSSHEVGSAQHADATAHRYCRESGSEEYVMAFDNNLHRGVFIENPQHLTAHMRKVEYVRSQSKWNDAPLETGEWVVRS